MSLRDQLVKAGLASKDKAKEIAKEQKQRTHKAHRDKNIRNELNKEKEAFKSEIQAFDKEKRQMDNEKNRELQQQQLKKSVRLEARRLIDTERLNDKAAEERFSFSSDGKKIRSVRVTKEQSIKLAKGELAICRNDRDGFDFPIVSKKIAERLLEIEEIEKGRWIYFLANPEEVSEAEDEWAAWDAYDANLNKK